MEWNLATNKREKYSALRSWLPKQHYHSCWYKRYWTLFSCLLFFSISISGRNRIPKISILKNIDFFSSQALWSELNAKHGLICAPFPNNENVPIDYLCDNKHLKGRKIGALVANLKDVIYNRIWPPNQSRTIWSSDTAAYSQKLGHSNSRTPLSCLQDKVLVLKDAFIPTDWNWSTSFKRRGLENARSQTKLLMWVQNFKSGQKNSTSRKPELYRLSPGYAQFLSWSH